MIRGRKSLDNFQSDESSHLISLAQEKVKSDPLVDLIDKHVNDIWNADVKIRNRESYSLMFFC
jgi:hypothetical protein